MSQRITRRTMLRLSAAAALGLSACRRREDGSAYPIQIHDDLLAGHGVRQALASAVRAPGETRDLVVVGGGISGLAAAWSLRHRDPLVLELGARLGGSAASIEDEGRAFAAGAHYELEYPRTYGDAVPAMLTELGLMRYDAPRAMWTFTDERHLIDPSHLERSFFLGQERGELLPPTGDTARLRKLLAPFQGAMHMPTTRIHPQYRPLNDVDLLTWLYQQGLTPSLPLRMALDYHMKDDYGAGAGEVSALAGIHYYQCRPYEDETVRVFSPPNGNAYFAEALAGALAPNALQTRQLVYRVEPRDAGLRLHVLDLAQGTARAIDARHVVYAGHKHALPFLGVPERRPAPDYAPWVVINFLVEDLPPREIFWQRDVISNDARFLGFVDSGAQAAGPGPTCFTVYFCMPREHRGYLEHLTGEQAARRLCDAAARIVGDTLGLPFASMIRRAHVKLHGHGMPIPAPGHLFRDLNQGRPLERLVYAGVDNGRLPLLFEALDSGLAAARLLTGSPS